MRGKIKPETLYRRLRKNMLEIYKNYPEQNAFYLMFKVNESFDNISYMKDEFDWDSKTPANILYHILRIVKAGVAWRELENFAEDCFSENQNIPQDRQRILAEAFAILYSFGLADYKFPYAEKMNFGISNSLYVFIKEVD